LVSATTEKWVPCFILAPYAMTNFDRQRKSWRNARQNLSA
jgi:hypothetical protein